MSSNQPDAPAWLARLFPETGPPDRLARRLRRIAASEIEASGRIAGSVVVELTYPGLAGGEETGQARLFLPPILREDRSRRVPLVHNAGYELDENGARALLAKGYAVCTPHAHPLNPLGRGILLDRAILHAARALPFVDPRRVSIQGGSAGGWMTLMLAADSFPLVCAMPDVPPIHWGYNAAFLAEHREMAGPPPGSETPRMPILQIVAGLPEQAQATYGMPFDSPTFLALSPLDHLDTITVPTLATFSSADILVPIDQVGQGLAQPIDPSRFPAGFSTALTDRFPGVKGRRTLLAALPRRACTVFRVPVATDLPRFKLDGAPPPGNPPLVLPFSKTTTWSVVLLDEGPVEPEDGHAKYFWGMNHEPFRDWAEGRGVQAEQLTGPKLARLMKRLRGEPWRPFKIRPGGKGPTIDGNVLDYPEAERADVIGGLCAFAQDDACARRLGELYAHLPARLRLLGARLGDGTAEGVRSALLAL